MVIMINVERVMKSKKSFKQKIDEVLPKEDSDRAWKDAEKRLTKICEEYPNLPKGVRAHTDTYIFPVAAIYLAIKEVAPKCDFRMERGK